MSPNSTPGGLNIDTMLLNLDSSDQNTTPVEQIVNNTQTIPEVVPSVSNSFVGNSLEQDNQPVPGFTLGPVIDATTSLSTQTVPSVVSSPTVSVTQPVLDVKTKRKLVLPAGLRIAVSGFLTILVLVILGWVMSVRYPEEANTFLDGITRTFSTLAGVTEKNMNPDGIKVVDGQEEVHSVAQEDPYMLDSPLADAMDNATGIVQDPNQAEQVFGTVVSGDDNTIDFDGQTTSDTGTISDTGDSTEIITNASGTETTTGTPVSTHTPDFDLPSMTDIPSVSLFQTQLLDLSEKAQSAMTNMIGNNDVSLAKMRVVYKNTQAMVEEIGKSQQVTQAKVDQYNSILALYNSVVQ